MPSLYRRLAFIAVCGLALACTACNSDSKKIVGKWKMVAMVDKDGKEQKTEIMGMTPFMEFTADGNIKVGMDTSNMPAEFKQKFDADKDAAAKMSESKQIGKYKVSGNTIEFVDVKQSEDSPLGKQNKGKMTFDGDNLTISGDNGSVKLTRMK